MIANNVAAFKHSRRCWKFPESVASSRFGELKVFKCLLLDAADRSFRKLWAAGFLFFLKLFLFHFLLADCQKGQNL